MRMHKHVILIHTVSKSVRARCFQKLSNSFNTWLLHTRNAPSHLCSALSSSIESSRFVSVNLQRQLHSEYDWCWNEQLKFKDTVVGERYWLQMLPQIIVHSLAETAAEEHRIPCNRLPWTTLTTVSHVKAVRGKRPKTSCRVPRAARKPTQVIQIFTKNNQFCANFILDLTNHLSKNCPENWFWIILVFNGSFNRLKMSLRTTRPWNWMNISINRLRVKILSGNDSEVFDWRISKYDLMRKLLL